MKTPLDYAEDLNAKAHGKFYDDGGDFLGDALELFDEAMRTAKSKGDAEGYARGVEDVMEFVLAQPGYTTHRDSLPARIRAALLPTPAQRESAGDAACECGGGYLCAKHMFDRPDVAAPLRESARETPPAVAPSPPASSVGPTKTPPSVPATANEKLDEYMDATEIGRASCRERV